MTLNLKYISARRKEMKLSMQDVANTLGFKTASTYYKYECGIYKFKAEMLPVLAKTLNCDIKNFFL